MSDVVKLAPGVKYIGYNTPLHKKVISNFLARKKMARDEQRKKREEEWKNSENIFTAYMPETDVDRVRAGKRKSGETEYTTISIPYSYAMLLTAHTYYTLSLIHI